MQGNKVVLAISVSPSCAYLGLFSTRQLKVGLFFPLPFSTHFLCQSFLAFISAPTGFHNWGLVTKWTQLLITSLTEVGLFVDELWFVGSFVKGLNFWLMSENVSVPISTIGIHLFSALPQFLHSVRFPVCKYIPKFVIVATFEILIGPQSIQLNGEKKQTQTSEAA